MKEITEADVISNCLRLGDIVFLEQDDLLTKQAKDYIENNGMTIVKITYENANE
ncbi:MAG: hypothetical protein RR911_04745 [Oscillospiraceae bacterium]